MGRLPKWHKGRLRREAYGGFWYGEREGKLMYQEGKLVDKQMFDKLTDKQRQEQVDLILNKETKSYSIFNE